MQASSCDVRVVVVEGVVVVVLVVLFSCDGNSENSGAVILTFPVVSKKRYGNLKLRSQRPPSSERQHFIDEHRAFD